MTTSTTTSTTRTTARMTHTHATESLDPPSSVDAFSVVVVVEPVEAVLPDDESRDVVVVAFSVLVVLAAVVDVVSSAVVVVDLAVVVVDCGSVVVVSDSART